jgi:hypothetical protein
MSGNDESSETPGAVSEAERADAIRRLKKRRDFGAHAVTFVVVNAGLWVLWAVTGAGYPWPAWITGAWAIGLVLNAWDVYWRRPITEAEIRRQMERARDQR